MKSRPRWFLGASPRRPSARGQTPKARPALEVLEGRLAPHAGHAHETLVPPPAILFQPADPAGCAPFDVPGGAPGASGGTASQAPAVNFGTLPNGMPILNSLPQAPAAIFLDFDGDAVTNTQPYDVDGNPAAFSATEQGQIAEAWRQIATYFAVFDVNVTTVFPGANVPKAWLASGNNIRGGYSYVNVFPNSRPQSFNQSADVRTRASGLAHELGHNFGLDHQSDYDLLGNKTAEYSRGFDDLHGPIMGVDYARSVHKWFIGHPSSSPSRLQDDLAVVAAQIRRFQPPGGDGYRADDFGGTLAAATPLGVNGTTQFVAGNIERLNDVDAFTFTSPGGALRLAATPEDPSAVDLKIEVYSSTGQLLAAADGPTNNQVIAARLPAGTYTVLVSGHGDYGDVGQYNFTVTPTTVTTPPPTFNNLPAPGGVAAARGSGTGLTLTWNAVAGATGYVVERSANGVDFTQAGTAAAGATAFDDPNLTGALRYFYRVSASDASGRSAPSAVVNALTRPGAVFNFTVTSWREDALILNWRDVSGDSGYRVERSSDGVTFRAVGTVGRNVPSFTDTGLTAGTRYTYRVVTLDGGADAAGATAAGTTRGTPPTNAAPTVATPATATPSPARGTTTNLAVLGADDGGEANLTYTWVVTAKPTGAADPTFRVNATNASKNTTATFAQAGSYTFQVTLTDAGGRTATSTVTVAVEQTLTRITVSPPDARAAVGQTLQLTASALDQFNRPLAAQPAVTWSVTGGGTVSATGLFTAPAAAGTSTVTATAGAVSGSATVTVVAATDDHVNVPGPGATPILLSTTGQGQATGVLERAGDRDVFQVDLARSGYLTTRLTATNGLDTYLRLYDANGNQVAFNDDVDGTLNSRLRRFLAPGRYFISAGAYLDRGTGGYRVDLLFEADDAPNGISTLSPQFRLDANGSGQASGVLERAGDRDSFRVSVTRAGTYQFDLAGLAGLATRLRLYNGNGVLVADSGNGAAGQPSRLRNTLAAGVYYLVAGSALDQGVGNYTLAAALAT